MHGLIFKIKESHRQDQSESFVIYIHKDIYNLSVFTTSQMKSLHYDQCYIITYINKYDIFVVSSRRNKTNPYHRNKFIPVLFMQLICKHSSPNYQHMINYWKLINKMLVYIYICMHKLKHFQPHSLLCHLWCILFVISSFLYDISIWLFVKLTKQLRQTFFFHHIYFIHIANQLYEYSHTSRTNTSSQHHPRETRPLLSQRNLYKKSISWCYTTSLFHI